MGPFIFLAAASVIISLCSADGTVHMTQMTTEVPCPDKCDCREGFKIVSCMHLGLSHVPENIPPQVQELYLSFNSLTSVGDSDFASLSNITVLSLKNNKISTISKNAFKNQVNMRSLYLSQNKLDKLDDSVFTSLASLQRLYIEQNSLSRMPHLGGLQSLYYLGLDNNKISNVTFANNGTYISIKSVMLNNNPISKLTKKNFEGFNGTFFKFAIARCTLTEIEPDIFSHFPGLISLDLSYNDMSASEVSKVITSLQGCKSLNSLKLNEAITGTLDEETFAGLTGVPLIHLFISHCKIDVVKNGSFSMLTLLQSLDLSYSQITSIEERAFYSISRLKTLKLNNNHLDRYPTGLPNSLEQLFLQNNPATEYIGSDEFKGLVKLQTLNIAGCRVRKIDKNAFVFLTALTTLDMSMNQIADTTFSKDLFDTLNKLQFLFLSGNRMVNIKTTMFDKLISLIVLDLSVNGCTSLHPQLLDKLVELSELKLKDNNLGKMIGSANKLLSKLQKLRKLDLSNNNIVTIPARYLEGLHSLEILNLTHNKIASWDRLVFKKTVKLRSLDLSSNLIESISEEQINNIPAHTSLNLSNNPFSCDCKLAWLRRNIDSPNFPVNLTDVENYMCNNKLMQDFDANEEWFKIKCWITDHEVIVIVGSIVLLFLLILIVTIVSACCCCYWKFMAFYYTTCKSIRRYNVQQLDTIALLPEGCHDAYILCSDDDTDNGIVEKIMNKLSNAVDYDCEGDMDIWFHNWHNDAGKTWHRELYEEVMKSKNVIILLTRSLTTQKKYTNYAIPVITEIAIKSDRKVFVIVQDKLSLQYTKALMGANNIVRKDIPDPCNEADISNLLDALGVFFRQNENTNA